MTKLNKIFLGSTFFTFITISLTAISFTACQSPPETPPSGPRISAAKEMRLKEQAQELNTKMQQNPCSVQVWEDENFQDDSDLIIGPLESADMKNLPGANKVDWSDEIDSLKVGPKATVTVWLNPNYNDEVKTFTAGTEKLNLRGNPNLGDDIGSIKITCNP